MAEDQLIAAILSIAVALATMTTYYFRAKGKISTIRSFIDDLDDALRDDQVSEEEYRKLWDRFSAIARPKKVKEDSGT